MSFFGFVSFSFLFGLFYFVSVCGGGAGGRAVSKTQDLPAWLLESWV
jgi:hypothetical protein